MAKAHSRPWHGDSTFGAVPLYPLDRERRAKWIWLTEAHRKAGRLPALQADIGRYLLTFLGAAGACFPSHETIAHAAGASTRTVRRALATLADLGLLTWMRRLCRVPWPAGGRGASRCAQDSNAYQILVPDEATASFNCGGQTVRQVRKTDKEKSIEPQSDASAVDHVAARAALTQRAATVEARLLMNKRVSPVL